MSSTTDTGRLMDRKRIAAELGVTNATAENLMRQLPKVQIGRRVFVLRKDVDAYLKRESSL
jgi:hypothetical protein